MFQALSAQVPQDSATIRTGLVSFPIVVDGVLDEADWLKTDSFG
jgi:hypothetical protein